jgi:ABC-type dipeptide/oligopeptide/nickel transport system ATPase subunit
MTKGPEVLARIRGVSKVFRSGSVDIHVLHELDLDLHQGEFLALMGPPVRARARCSITSAAWITPAKGKSSCAAKTWARFPTIKWPLGARGTSASSFNCTICCRR